MTKPDRCIATSCDANYFPALIALLRSLNKTNPHIPVIVFDGGMTTRQRRKAARFAGIRTGKPFMELEGRGKFSYIGHTTLLKLEVAVLEHDKVLYMDADTVVLEKLDPLFDIPEGRVGVVPEVNAVKNMFRARHRPMLMEALDIDWEQPGFNAGVFVLRPGEWRDLIEKARSVVDEFGEDVFSKSKDQQILNLIFSRDKYSIPARYNFSPMYDESAGSSPAIIHYLTGCKPWHMDYPRGRRYREFRANIRVTDHPAIFLVDAVRFLRGLREKSMPETHVKDTSI